MKVKYQIFVSSTFEDLKKEREVIIKAIHEMGHIPVGMEMFSAGDVEQWKLIQKQIDDSDYYIVIVAHRYGSLDGEISYTEKEYNYASSKGIPILGFIIDETTSWTPSFVDKDEDKIAKLNLFKEKLKQKMVGFWTSSSDLYAKIPIALIKQININPRTGWIRADQYSGPEILQEVSRLSKENSDLRKKLEEINFNITTSESEKKDNILSILKHNKRNLSFFYHNGDDWENTTEFTLFKIFNILAPELLIEKSTEDSSFFLGVMLNPEKDKDVREQWPISMNKSRQLLADLHVLDLVEPSKKRHPIKTNGEHWTLSNFGKEIYKIVRQEFLMKSLPSTNND